MLPMWSQNLALQIPEKKAYDVAYRLHTYDRDATTLVLLVLGSWDDQASDRRRTPRPTAGAISPSWERERKKSVRDISEREGGMRKSKEKGGIGNWTTSVIYM